MKIGIRREDKSEWERRVPLIPEDLQILASEGVKITIQPSDIRTFPDDMYRSAGAVVQEDLSDCGIIMAVKEIPIDFFEQDKTYIFFSHTMKGQEYNMPSLKRMKELGTTLIDYEPITDDDGNRLIFFGRFAGIAGMIDSLWALSERMKAEGNEKNPFESLKMAHEYESLEEAKAAVSEIGEIIKNGGLSKKFSPLVTGFTGYGNVSQGAQEIYDLLPVEEITPADLADGNYIRDHRKVFKTVFKEIDTVVQKNSAEPFDLQHYFDNPTEYESQFEKYLPRLSMLINCVYWTPACPRLVTKKWVKEAFSGQHPPKLRVIGDISIDIEGSIECSLEATDSGNPIYVYDPAEDKISYGAEGNGPVIMAIDNLPCELPHEASATFSKALMLFIHDLLKTDFNVSFNDLMLPPPLKRGMIVHRGRLTPDFEYLREYLNF